MKANKLRLLFIVDAIQGRNGVGTYFQDLAAHLERHEAVECAELVAPCMETPHPCQGRALRMPGDATQQLYLPKWRTLKQKIQTLRPNVIIVPGPGPFALAGYWIARRQGIPVCVTHQSDYRAMVKLYWHPVLAAPVGNLVESININMFRGSAAVVTISQSMVEHARQLGAREPRLVPTPVAHDFIHRPTTAPRPDITRTLFVGRLAAEKNIDHFLALAEQRPDLSFEIVGDGPGRQAVEEAAERLDNLVFTGWLPRERVIERLDDCDLLILPSSVEAFGTVALEAMARQRLVLTTAACGINEWQELNKGLYVMTEGEDLSAALRRLESLGPAQRHETARRARDAACRLNEHAIQQWLGALQETAKSS